MGNIINYKRPVIILMAAFAICLILFQALPGAAFTVFGYMEWAAVGKAKIRVLAKLDTGADDSSIHAPSYEFFTKKGKRWVRFKVTGVNGKTAVVEKKILKMTMIKQRKGPNAIRPLIRLKICVGDIRKKALVNLADRSGLDCPLLIGRSFLSNDILVSSFQKFTKNPSCR
jgi:hypothetical protein